MPVESFSIIAKITDKHWQDIRIKGIDRKGRSKELHVLIHKKIRTTQSVNKRVISLKSDYDKWVYRNRLTRKMEEFFDRRRV